MLDLRRETMRPIARLVPLGVHSQARKVLTTLRTIGVTADDVVAASYPKAGSTWLRFMIADLSPEASDADFATLVHLSPPLGQHRAAPRLIDGRGRFIKTHESFSAFYRFPGRALYMVRDGRDVAVSMYHFLERVNVQPVLFSDYLEAFLAGRVVPYGSWQDHVIAWLRAAEKYPDRVAVLRYEELLTATGPEVLQQTLAQIGWNISLEAAKTAVERNSLESMRAREERTDLAEFPGLKGRSSSMPFVRVGKAEQWRDAFTEEQQRRFQQIAGAALELAGYKA